jgi:hypothetical protein
MADDETQNGATIGDRAADGEHEEDLTAPPEPPVRGDAQLTLNLGSILSSGARKVTEATIALSAQEVAIDGLLKPDETYTFLVTGKVQHYVSVPIRDTKTDRTVGMKQRQPVRTLRVQRADGAEAIADLYDALLITDAEEAGKLLDELRARASEVLAEA